MVHLFDIRQEVSKKKKLNENNNNNNKKSNYCRFVES